MPCECSVMVDTGTAGHHNLEQHRLSKAHRDRMVSQKTPKITSFFSPRPSTSQRTPHVHSLQNQVQSEGPSDTILVISDSDTEPDISLTKSKSTRIAELRQIAARLPLSIPEASHDDRLAAFAIMPIFEPAVDFWEEEGDSYTQQSNRIRKRR